MSVPFLSVKPRAIKLKVLPRFPANVIGRNGIDVTKDGGNFIFDLDYTDFPVIGALPPAATYALIYDPATGKYAQAPISLLGANIPEPPADSAVYGRANTAGTGAWARAVAAAGDAMTGDLTINKINPSFNLDTPPGGVRNINGKNAGLTRWALQLGGGDPESGGNTGSNFYLLPYTDTGAWAGTMALKGTRATGLLEVAGNPTAALGIATKQYVDANAGGGGVARSYLAGLTLSTAGASITFSVAAGVATDSTNANMMALAAAISKTTAAWAVGSGAGSFDGTGAAPSATADWYHVHLIKRTDTNVVEVLTSRSATAPTLPSGYTLFRRIGALKTNGSFQWIKFSQLGDEFLWDVRVTDFTNVVCSTTPALFAFSVPTGVQVSVLGYVRMDYTGGATSILLTSPDESSQAASAYIQNGTVSASLSQAVNFVQCRTNTSAQLRVVSAGGTINANWGFGTYGWIDRRGRHA
ncbi:hypothetical protein [Bradyrhizobium arachidis]|uniref:Uncharacterized protein n=1 Tax=Bradyrhizobium arachidis TaxID=858423 RepID=A0AAE7NMY3_9BRAD|nr:hypothetical protein [Bradyrhizobium arachidis]QOZ68894.1 hypothetical protein WN72_23115 [Bradyrhizobium arachidis]SFV19437.1 hypothetical protein SAMN05192541_15118 [Bradyrhizobium arachidis]